MNIRKKIKDIALLGVMAFAGSFMCSFDKSPVKEVWLDELGASPC